MTIASEITRLQGLKSRIRTKLISLGLVNSSTATLSDCTTAVEGITGTQAITDASTQYNVAGKQYAQVSSNTLVPSNIVSGVNILGVVGTAAVNPPSANLQAGAVYYGGANAPASLYPSSGYDGFSHVTVELTDANRMLTAGNVRSGVTIMGVTGTYETTTEAKAPTLSELKTAGVTDHSVTITPSTSGRHLSQVTIPRITNDIDSNIVAGNIKKDVTILGVTGTYRGSMFTQSSTYGSWEQSYYSQSISIDVISGFDVLIVQLNPSDTQQSVTGTVLSLRYDGSGTFIEGSYLSTGGLFSKLTSAPLTFNTSTNITINCSTAQFHGQYRILAIKST